MANFVMLTFSNAVQNKESEFDTWYDEVHIAEVLTIPGFVAAQRFEHATGTPEGL